MTVGHISSTRIAYVFSGDAKIARPDKVDSFYCLRTCGTNTQLVQRRDRRVGYITCYLNDLELLYKLNCLGILGDFVDLGAITTTNWMFWGRETSYFRAICVNISKTVRDTSVRPKILAY